jgi:hypothetical protein
MSDKVSIPVELEQTLRQFEDALEQLRTPLEPILKIPLEQHLAEMNPLEKVKMEVLLGYTMNSLFSSKTSAMTQANHIFFHADVSLFKNPRHLTRQASCPSGTRKSYKPCKYKRMKC